MSTMQRSDVENFLYKEARLLDASLYDEWLSMWAEDSIYWVPFEPNSDPNRKAAIVYVTREQLADRLFRLNTGNVYSQDPAPRLSRVIANIEIEPANGSDQLKVHSVFNLTQLRRGSQSTFAGRNEHLLTAIDDGFQIASKKVVLVNRQEPIPNLTFFL